MFAFSPISDHRINIAKFERKETRIRLVVVYFRLLFVCKRLFPAKHIAMKQLNSQAFLKIIQKFLDNTIVFVSSLARNFIRQIRTK